MTRYVAAVNVPGYSPMDDDPPVFDSAEEAWTWLADERERSEEEAESVESESEGVTTVSRLRAGAVSAKTQTDPTGCVYGGTPGYERYGAGHDLGLAYCVSVHECDELCDHGDGG